MRKWVTDSLEELKKQHLHRSLQTFSHEDPPYLYQNGKKYLNFASNDYLGLSHYEQLKETYQEGVKRYGIGATASRLLCGTHPAHQQLEETLAQFKQTESALSFSSGYTAGIGVITSLVGKGDYVILDKLCHACLIDGARLSGATMRVYPHRHIEKLEKLLQTIRAKINSHQKILLVTESIFSMDGDHAPLSEIVRLKQKYGAFLLVDEAHAVGIIGNKGKGLADYQQVRDIDLHMGTLSKAVGVSGGYICASRSLIDLLINRTRSFIYTTAPPPATALTAKTALHIIQSEEGDSLRKKLWENIRFMSNLLNVQEKANLSAIFPYMIGDEKSTIKIGKELKKKGIYLPAIRYPTVPKNKARLRLTVCADHGKEDILLFKKALFSILETFGQEEKK